MAGQGTGVRSGGRGGTGGAGRIGQLLQTLTQRPEDLARLQDLLALFQSALGGESASSPTEAAARVRPRLRAQDRDAFEGERPSDDEYSDPVPRHSVPDPQAARAHETFRNSWRPGFLCNRSTHALEVEGGEPIRPDCAPEIAAAQANLPPEDVQSVQRLMHFARINHRTGGTQTPMTSATTAPDKVID